MSTIKIGTTDYARTRHTPDSGFSYFTGSWEELEDLVSAQLTSVMPGYREGCVIVSIPETENFRSTLHTLTEGDAFRGVYAPRIPGEAPRKQIFTTGEPDVAETVQIVLYSSELLAKEEQPANSLPVKDGNWEIVAILASVEKIEGEMPMDPDTLMYNHFEGSGGTATGMSDSEFIAQLKTCWLFWGTRSLKTGATPKL